MRTNVVYRGLVVLLLSLFGWQSLASAMILPCRFSAEHGTETAMAAHAHAQHQHHSRTTEQARPSHLHDCGGKGFCEQRHCASVAFAVPPSAPQAIGFSGPGYDVSPASAIALHPSPDELMRPPRRG
jgi:hypothetical protein